MNGNTEAMLYMFWRSDFVFTPLFNPPAGHYDLSAEQTLKAYKAHHPKQPEEALAKRAYRAAMGRNAQV